MKNSDQRAGAVCLLAFMVVIAGGHEFVRAVRGRREQRVEELA